YINDVGGPTANFRNPACDRQLKYGACKHRQCLYPEPCEHLNVDHEDYRELLSKLRVVDGVKKVFIRSGIRYDYLMHDESKAFFFDLC
ncbi:MAG TPA: YgiQ family radical SAM protein, partial [Clostridiales bacterium UBA8960]|nr:YgiQ family radical SAM protein [Clostridiales bacterium UBA8960]